MFPITSFANEMDKRYSNDQIESIVLKYEYNEDMLNDMFCEASYLGYWGMINDIKKNKTLTWALDMSSILIEEYPEKQDYAEILANLITMQSGELAEQIESQSRFDDLKNIGDYAWDVAEITAAFIGASGALETISTAIGTGVDGVSDVIIKSSDQAKYYEATLQDYSQSFAFLNAISQYSENEELRNVAGSLHSANDALLFKRLEYLADASENIVVYEAKFFVENMSMELLREADLYATDETVKWFVDEGINLKNVLLSAKDAFDAVFKTTILAGDIGFGTSNVYNRYQEMKVITDIASSLVKAKEAVDIPPQTSEAKLAAIQEKCNYYKALLVTHARGEYLLYQLLMNDAGALSDIRWIIEYFKNPEDTTDVWYEKQVGVLTQYCDILDNLFVVNTPETYAWTVMPQEGFEIIGMTYSSVPNTTALENDSDINNVGSVINDGLYIAQRNGLYGLMDLEGHWVVKPEYAWISYDKELYLFDDGTGDDEWNVNYKTLSEEKVVDLDIWELESTSMAPDTVSFFTAEEYCVRTWGDMLVSYAYEYPNVVPPRYSFANTIGVDQFTFTRSADGYNHITTGSNYAIASCGELKTDFIYEDICAFSDGLIAIKQNGKWGYADSTGNTVIPCQYEACRQKAKNSFAYKFDIPTDCTDGYVVLFDGEAYSLFDNLGNEIIPFGTFECLTEIHDGKLWAKQNGKWGVLDLIASFENRSNLDDNQIQLYPATGKFRAGYSCRTDNGIVSGTHFINIHSIDKGQITFSYGENQDKYGRTQYETNPVTVTWQEDPINFTLSDSDNNIYRGSIKFENFEVDQNSTTNERTVYLNFEVDANSSWKGIVRTCTGVTMYEE